MKKIIIGIFALASVVVLSGCSLNREKEDAIMLEGMAPKEGILKDDAMMKHDEAMMKDNAMVRDDAMMKKDVQQVQGYAIYSHANVEAALTSGKKVALFFHAPWCPTCKALDTSLSSATVPSDVVVFKVDYDSSTELKKKYGVTGQHTIVTLDANKNKIKLERGSQNIADIIALF